MHHVQTMLGSTGGLPLARAAIPNSSTATAASPCPLPAPVGVYACRTADLLPRLQKWNSDQ